MENKDFRIVGGILLEYNGTSKDVVVPGGVNVISAWSLANKNISTLVIPDSVTNINSYALLGNELSMLTMPSTIEQIRENIYDYLKTLCIINKGNLVEFLSKLENGGNLGVALSIEIKGNPLTEEEQVYISTNLSTYNIIYKKEEERENPLNNEPLIVEILTNYIKELEDTYHVMFPYTKEQRRIIINYLLDASIITNLEQGKKLLESVFMEASINLQSNITTHDILMMILKIKAEESKKAQTSR